MKPSTSRSRCVIAVDGEGIVNHAGSSALIELADRLQLTQALSRAMSPLRQRQSAHDPGVVLRDLIVMLADGGDCLSDLSALREQPDLFGEVASTPTAWRVIDSITEAELGALREARRQARAQAWELGARPEEIILDFDSTLVTAHSEKEQAAGNYKHGFGFHPLLCYLDASEEALSGILRPGNAGANTAADHVEVLEAVWVQLPESAKEKEFEILARGDSAAASHDFLDALRARKIRFSVGFDLTEPVREAILKMPRKAWLPARTQEGEVRQGAAVCELSGLDLSAWPSGTRAICRRERPHPGAQLSFSDHNGYRFQVFITDQPDADIVALEARHRAHARVEDRVRCAKDTGLNNLPFREFRPNQVWLELVLAAQDLLAFFRQLCLAGEARQWEPKKLRFRLFHTAARLVRSGRRLILRLQRTWRWTADLAAAFRRLRALPAT